MVIKLKKRHFEKVAEILRSHYRERPQSGKALRIVAQPEGAVGGEEITEILPGEIPRFEAVVLLENLSLPESVRIRIRESKTRA